MSGLLATANLELRDAQKLPTQPCTARRPKTTYDDLTIIVVEAWTAYLGVPAEPAKTLVGSGSRAHVLPTLRIYDLYRRPTGGW